MDVSKKVLVVDDMLTMRKIVQKFCIEIGFSKIELAADGKMAWETIQAASEQFGLIISDINMPNMTGIELLEKVRANEKTAAIPFILLTAESEKEFIDAALKNKVNGYIVKPFTKEILLKNLQKVA